MLSAAKCPKILRIRAAVRGLRSEAGRERLPEPRERPLDDFTRKLVRLGVCLWFVLLPLASLAQAAKEPTPPPAKAEPRPAPSTSPAPGPAPKTKEPAGQGDGARFRVRLRELEQRVEELKEQIRRSHTRLSLLSETVLSGGQSGGRLEIRFENELSAAWHIVEITVVFDGAVQYKRSDESGLISSQKSTPIFSGAVPAGDHTVQVLLKLRGHGFGIFSYLRGIEATVRQDHSFSLTSGQDIEVIAIGWESGGPTTPAEKRPDVRFHEVIKERQRSKARSVAPTTESGGSGGKR